MRVWIVTVGTNQGLRFFKSCQTQVFAPDEGFSFGTTQTGIHIVSMGLQPTTYCIHVAVLSLKHLEDCVHVKIFITEKKNENIKLGCSASSSLNELTEHPQDLVPR